MRRNLRDAPRSAIHDGRLSAVTMLPASRTLAGDLGISRGVVTDVYEQLAAEGYLLTSPRRAPFVAAVARVASMAPEALPRPWRYDFIATIRMLSTLRAARGFVRLIGP
jgi:GntR family transcriptional regulator/MocR family aminotransferase